MGTFEVVSAYKPTGDQPQAIGELAEGIRNGQRYQTLLGVTGSGKTFTIANVIEQVKKPTLVISHNKTLAAQLYGELRALFPNNAVEYFISYYDYYQPEAYIPGRDLYIEKDSDINSEIEKLRLRATMSLAERNDVIIVASVSCIYGLGIPRDFKDSLVLLRVGDVMDRDELLEKLVSIQYGRNDIAFERGAFRVKGDIVDIYPAYLDKSLRVEFFGDEIERITRINPIDNHIIEELTEFPIYPANHFIVSQDSLERAIGTIEDELKERVRWFLDKDMFVEAQRLEQRTKFDLEMLRELGHCSGIENYSRHLTGMKQGDPPYCLLDYFPEDFLVVIDESHATIPQVHGMYGGDFTRKKNLVDYGFRLPSAFDNRPLRFEEFTQHIRHAIFVSATPGDWELEQSDGVFVEQVIRPTGLVDPVIEIKPVATQVDDLLEQVRGRTQRQERILVTTLTKRMAEDLATYLTNAGVRARYMHSDLDTIERSKVIRDLRLGNFDVLVGINLLREGLDLPEVSLVAILDADKSGFLRNTRSLIQTAGRAARNVNGKVVFYADELTPAIRQTVEETNRRRAKQLAYNEEHGITPSTIQKSVDDIMLSTSVAEGYDEKAKHGKTPGQKPDKTEMEDYFHLDSKEKVIEVLKKEMAHAARSLDFERAAELRDRIFELEEMR